MILLVDIGNTNICLGVVKNNKIISTYRIKTSPDKSADEYYLFAKEFIKEDIDDVIISSVVPIVTSIAIKMFKTHYNIEPKVIGNKLKTGIKILADDPKTVGADLICNVAAASNYFDKGLIVDLGTASKFIYFEKNTFVSVSIAPGMSVSMKGLVNSAALLPNFELVAPVKVLNTSTIPCMQSGVIYGFASLVDGMIERIKIELNNPNLKIVATGGLSKLISNYTKEKIDVNDPNLTLEGIYEIYKRNFN